MPIARGTRLEPVADQEAELVRLEATGRERALTREESERLALLEHRRWHRQIKLTSRIARTRAKLKWLEARLQA